MPGPNALHIKGRTVIWPSGEALVATRAAGRFLAHRSDPGTRSRYFSLTLPTGMALGTGYPSQKSALLAAEALAPLVTNWEGDDLLAIFGDNDTARRAYDLARPHMKG
jgi:hypothetical protein